jgi:hypothetical protein
METIQDVFKFHEFSIPVHLLDMTGGEVNTFEVISKMHIDLLRKFIGIRQDDHFLAPSAKRWRR